ncbi:MAG: DinB family protein [Chitinophagales bacterium]|nr:DinB family protein [Chitinophagales bacterium]
MNKSQIAVVPSYYQRYIEQAPDQDLLTALQETGVAMLLSERSQLVALGDHVYAPDKWTVRAILQHIIDAERIFAYRALRLARNDKTPLPGFDEDSYANVAPTQHRSIDDLFEELGYVRESTWIMFRQFDETTMLRTGICSNHEMSVVALGFIIVGHLMHHLAVVKDRYYPLLSL